MKLKPCPFCDFDDVEIMYEYCSAFVGCNGCGAQGPQVCTDGYDSEDECIEGVSKAWNERLTPPKQ